MAQLTLALLLELAHRTGHHSQRVHSGAWSTCPDWCFWDHPLVELDGLAFGVVGHGRIGAAAGALASAFGMRVLAHARRLPEPAPAGVTFVGLDDLFRQSDVVSLHCPLTPETKGLVNAERLALMKPTAFLLNTSRGPLVDETALAAALNQGQIAGAGLDVLGLEPPVNGSPLFGARNCVVTPHFAWATRAARARLMETTVQNVRAFLAGNVQNRVN